jgi:hypothetical protein
MHEKLRSNGNFLGTTSRFQRSYRQLPAYFINIKFAQAQKSPVSGRQSVFGMKNTRIQVAECYHLQAKYSPYGFLCE